MVNLQPSEASNYQAILESSRSRFEFLIQELKKRKEVGQVLEFAVAKVAAELESLECLIKEIDHPSTSGSESRVRELACASLGKLIPHFLVNLDRLGLQCGVELKGSQGVLISALFEKNGEFTEVLVNKY